MFRKSPSRRPTNPASRLHRRKELGAETNADGYIAAIALVEVLRRDGHQAEISSAQGAFTAATSLQAILRRGIKYGVSQSNPAFTWKLAVDQAGCEFRSLGAKAIQALNDKKVIMPHLDPSESMDPANCVLSMINISSKADLAHVELEVTERDREEAQTRKILIKVAYGHMINDLDKFLSDRSTSARYRTDLPLYNDKGDEFRSSQLSTQTLPVWQGCAVFLVVLFEVVCDYREHRAGAEWELEYLYWLLLLLWADKAKPGIVPGFQEADIARIFDGVIPEQVAHFAYWVPKLAGENANGQLETQFAKFWQDRHAHGKVTSEDLRAVRKACRWGLERLVELVPRRDSGAQRSQPQDHTTSRGPRLRPTRTGRPKPTHNATLDSDSDSPEPCPPPPRRSFPQRAAPTGHGPGSVPVDRYGQPLPPGQPTFVRGPPISLNKFTPETRPRTTRHSFSTSQRPAFSPDPVYDLPHSRRPQYERRHPFDDDDDLRPRHPPHQDPPLQRTTSTRTRDKQSSRAPATSSAGREGYSSRGEQRQPDPLAEAARVIGKSRRDMEERREENRNGRDDNRAPYVERKPNDVSRKIKPTSTGVRIVRRVSRGPEDRSRSYSYVEVTRR